MRVQFSEDGADVLLLSSAEIRALLDLPACVAAVEDVFRRLGRGEAPSPGVLGFETEGGSFHLKAGLSGDGYFVAKLNGNYPGNPRVGLPTIQGLLVLADAANGRPLAVMDSAELTARRTGAATGVAVKYLTPVKPLVVTLIGCGRQAPSQLEAVAAVRGIARVHAIDQEMNAAAALVRRCPPAWDARTAALDDMRAATRTSDLIITCTTTQQAFLSLDDAASSCLVCGVGADNPHKSELTPALMAASVVVTDLTSQCAVMGDLHHAIEAGKMKAGDVAAELAEIVIRPRAFAGERVIFDSTGMALQDAAAARVVYQRALRR